MNCWIITAACCFINFLLLGIFRISPVLYVTCMDEFKITRAEASFPIVISFLLRTLSGPVIGFLGHKYGMVKITLLGSILSFIGIGSCYFANNIIMFTICWGMITGLGCGFGTHLLPAVLDLTFDDKNKTKANGIALAGSSLGGMTLPLILHVFIHKYGFPGSLLMMSALILHAVPASLLLFGSESGSKKTTNNNEFQQKTKLHSTQIDDQNFSTDKHSNRHESNCYENEFLNRSEMKTIQRTLRAAKYPSMNGNDNLGFSDEFILSNVADNLSTQIFSNNDYCDGQNIRNVRKITTNLNTLRKSMELSETTNLNQVSKVRGNFSEKEPKKITENGAKVKTEEVKDSFSIFRIFIDPAYILIMLIQSSNVFVTGIVFLILIDVVRDKDVDKNKEIYCVFFFTLSDMIGHISLGWITDRGYLSNTSFIVISSLLLSLFSLFFIWVFNWMLILLSIFLFTFVSGGLFAVFPAVICEFVATQDKMMAISSRMLLMAPMSFAMYPLIGYFREQCKSYDGIFYVCGGICLLCGGMAALVPRLSGKSQKYDVSQNV